MSNYRVIGKKVGLDGEEYEIRQYGSWVRQYVNDAGELVEERGSEPDTETEKALRTIMMATLL